MDVVEVGWGDGDWIGLAQHRDRWKALVNLVLNHWVPETAGQLWRVLTTRDLSSSAQLHAVSLVTPAVRPCLNIRHERYKQPKLWNQTKMLL
jgi:hypothetical protein